MTDIELTEIIKSLRNFTNRKREEHTIDETSVFFINVIEIACNLTELGLSKSRNILVEEEYWFGGSYHMNFWNAEIESKFYSELTSEVRKRKYFRK